MIEMKYIKHIGIYVNNLDIMTIFYQTVFDLIPISTKEKDYGGWLEQLGGEAGSEIYITKLITQLGAKNQIGDMIELVQVSEKIDHKNVEVRNMIEPGTTHIAFGVEDIFNTANRIEKCGGKIVVTPTRRLNGKWFSFARDIENNWLELIQI